MSSVDIVVPCYRYGHFLRECVESVLAQQEVEVRILVIDDASPDDTAEVATELTTQSSRVTFVRHATNKGHIATYNEGIDWATADYYMILSADDYLLPGALASAASLMDAHPNVGLTYSRAVTLDHCGTNALNVVDEAKGAAWRVLPGLEFIKLCRARNIVPTPTAVVRTSLQRRLGGYRPELPHSGDLEMWLRLAAHSAVGVSEAYHAVYRRHSENMSLLFATSSCLPDLQQRKAAFDCFINSWGDTLQSPEKIHRRLSWFLACDAVTFASAAFNEGEMEDSERLSEFALRICPQVKRSLRWAKLTCKRGVGREAWCALQPAVHGIRQAALPLKRVWRHCVRASIGASDLSVIR